MSRLNPNFEPSRNGSFSERLPIQQLPEMLTPQQRLFQTLNLPLIDVVGLVVLFLAGFLMLVDVAVGKDEVALDGQVLAKLAVMAGCGLYGMFGFINDGRVRATLFSFPMLWMVLIIAGYFVSVAVSITPKESLASAIAMTCVTLMAVTAVIQLGPLLVVTTLFYSLCLYTIGSWAVFLLVPEVGVFAEPIEDGQFTMRMSGLAHPNTLGQFSGLTLVLGSILWFKFGQRSFWRVGIALLAAGALIGSLSRTSMAATMFALAISFRHRLLGKNLIYPAAALLMLMSIVLVVASFDDGMGTKIEDKLASLSKSGDSEELTTATGRAEIWAYAAKLIAQRPLTGYGAATSKYYLADFSSYTHNLIINVAFSTGIVGGLLALCMCLSRFWNIFTNSHPIADGIVAFILFNGLFENVMFSFLAGLPTIIWVVALCLPQWMPTQEIEIAATATTTPIDRSRTLQPIRGTS